MSTYKVFSRSCWQKARSGNWPGNIEPLAVPPEECETIATGLSYEEAREMCTDYNENERDNVGQPAGLDRRQRSSHRLRPRNSRSSKCGNCQRILLVPEMVSGAAKAEAS